MAFSRVFRSYALAYFAGEGSPRVIGDDPAASLRLHAHERAKQHRRRNMIDLDKLLRLRLVVARFGELDGARWWNTKGQLGRLGAAALDSLPNYG